MMEKLWADITPKALLAINVFFYIWHLKVNYYGILYFCQLTIISLNMVILNFILSLALHQKKSTHKMRTLLSRLHLVTISVQAIVVIGFWGLRVFFSKGIVDPNEIRTWEIELLSVWVHAGPFLTMFYFIKNDRIVLETKKRKKYFFHLCWGVPFIFLQYLHWNISGEHVYGFLKYFDWIQLIVFECSLYYLAVAIDYSLTLRHGLKISLSHMKGNKTTIQDLQIEKEREQTMRELARQQQKRNKRVRSVPHAHKQIISPMPQISKRFTDKKKN